MQPGGTECGKSWRHVGRGVGLALSLAAGLAAIQPGGANAATSAPNTGGNQPSSSGGKRCTLLVLATGGTIAGQPNGFSAVGYKAGSLSGADLVASVPALGHLAQLRVEQIANIPSQDMNEAVWRHLAARIHQADIHHEACGIVITHGTDTMEESAYFLHKTYGGHTPVVITGAMRPASATSADGPANLLAAARTALAPQADGRGVLVVMNDQIHSARNVSKTHTTALQTFRSLNGGVAGWVDDDQVRFAQAPDTRTPDHDPLYDLPGHDLPRVDIIYVHAGLDAQPVEDAVARGAQGLVLAGVGDGNAPKAVLEALDKARAKGVLVVRSRRPAEGFTNRDVEVNDSARGFVAAGRLSPVQARLLAQLIIATGPKGVGEVQRAFDAE
ncbi:asparaginase [Formicincola oecophyllae]|uniref:Asparaginase n=2 Tax=Formicincola oecophyllae TaxID=2558361 RepID=A0A4Y6UEJ3_9PROT|nr:asparaginase [Formicincola oecophyllae]